MSYLVNKYGQDDPDKRKLYPSDPEQRANIDRILYFDIGSLYKNIVDYFHPMLMTGDDGNQTKENALKTSLDYLNGFLATEPYVSGKHLTIADFSVLASVTQMEGMDYKLSGYRHLRNWIERLKSELPYYDECNKAGIEMFRAWVKNKQQLRNQAAAAEIAAFVASKNPFKFH